RCGLGHRSSAFRISPAVVRALAAGLFTLSIAAGSCAPPAGANGYTITDLGTMDGDSSIANGINNSGEVVGDIGAHGDSAKQHAFLYDWTGMHPLSTPYGPWWTARAINDLGQVAGAAPTAHSGLHAYRYAP